MITNLRIKYPYIDATIGSKNFLTLESNLLGTPSSNYNEFPPSFESDIHPDIRTSTSSSHVYLICRIPPDKSTLFNSSVSFLQSPSFLNFVYFILLCKSYGETLGVSTKSQYQNIYEPSCDSNSITTRADAFVPLGSDSSRTTLSLSMPK